MRLYNVRGRIVSKNVSRNIIDWDGDSRSKIQRDVKRFLKRYWIGCVVYEEFPVYGTPMKVDILNASLRIAVEVNGPQHDSFNPFFHNNDPGNFLKSVKRDNEKRKWLELNNFNLVEINQDEVKSLSRDFFLEKYQIDL